MNSLAFLEVLMDNYREVLCLERSIDVVKNTS